MRVCVCIRLFVATFRTSLCIKVINSNKHVYKSQSLSKDNKTTGLTNYTVKDLFCRQSVCSAHLGFSVQARLMQKQGLLEGPAHLSHVL